MRDGERPRGAALRAQLGVDVGQVPLDGAHAEHELAGVRIPASARLMLMCGSANRDETVFPDPDRFDIRREQTVSHFAFGRGIHFCIGASLARLEGRVALEVLATRLPSLRLERGRPLTYQPNAAFRGPTELTLAWNAAR